MSGELPASRVGDRVSDTSHQAAGICRLDVLLSLLKLLMCVLVCVNALPTAVLTGAYVDQPLQVRSLCT
jgi:hypothetical protein